MAKPTATIVANWQRGMGQAGAAYTAGTAAVTASPMAAAAAQQQKAIMNFTAALQSGQWAAKLNATSMQYWKQQCAQAAAKLSQGAQKGQAKYTAAINALQPVYQEMRNAADAAGTDPIARSSAALAVLIRSGKKGRAMNGG